MPRKKKPQPTGKPKDGNNKNNSNKPKFSGTFKKADPYNNIAEKVSNANVQTDAINEMKENGEHITPGTTANNLAAQAKNYQSISQQLNKIGSRDEALDNRKKATRAYQSSDTHRVVNDAEEQSMKSSWKAYSQYKSEADVQAGFVEGINKQFNAEQDEYGHWHTKDASELTTYLGTMNSNLMFRQQALTKAAVGISETADYLHHRGFNEKTQTWDDAHHDIGQAVDTNKADVFNQLDTVNKAMVWIKKEGEYNAFETDLKAKAGSFGKTESGWGVFSGSSDTSKLERQHEAYVDAGEMAWNKKTKHYEFVDGNKYGTNQKTPDGKAVVSEDAQKRLTTAESQRKSITNKNNRVDSFNAGMKMGGSLATTLEEYSKGNVAASHIRRSI